MSSGSPTLVISGIVHFRSNALESTILKICWGGQTLFSERSDGDRRTFWTLMLWLVLLKISAARIAFAKRRACDCCQPTVGKWGSLGWWVCLVGHVPGWISPLAPRATD